MEQTRERAGHSALRSLVNAKLRAPAEALAEEQLSNDDYEVCSPTGIDRNRIPMEIVGTRVGCRVSQLVKGTR
jgi:hypothetical protein